MKHTTAQTTNGFAIELTDQTDLGLAMLVLETEDGQYQPIAVASSIGEAKEMAHHDFAGRIRELEAGGAPLCPYGYKVWARGIDGEYRIAAEIGVPRGKKST